jgi:hypothetical protein
MEFNSNGTNVTLMYLEYVWTLQPNRIETKTKL